LIDLKTPKNPLDRSRLFELIAICHRRIVKASRRKEINVNVREYFEQRMPAPYAQETMKRLHPNSNEDSFGSILESMPRDSNCGDDCVRCIDAAATLVEHIKTGFGDDLPRLIENTLYTAARVCSVYIGG
jgi:hypothetical protein